MPSRRNMQSAVISNASSGQQTLFTNPSTSAFAYVWEIYMTCAAAATCTFYDGPGACSGNVNVVAGGAISLLDNGYSPHFTVSPNATFNISEGVGTQKSGYVRYSN